MFTLNFLFVDLINVDTSSNTLGGIYKNVMLFFSIVFANNFTSVKVFSGYNTSVAPKHKGVYISETLTSNEIFVSDKQLSLFEIQK